MRRGSWVERRSRATFRPLPRLCLPWLLLACGGTTAEAPDDRPGTGTLSATDLGVGSVVRLAWRRPPDAPAPVEVLVLRREDAVPREPEDQRARVVFRGPPQAEYYDADATPRRVYRYAAFFSDDGARWRAGPAAAVDVGPRPVTNLRATDPGRGRRLELSWTNPSTPTTDLVRILRFVGACLDDPDPVTFDRRVDLPVAARARPQTWSDDPVTDGVRYCYAVFARSKANYLYAPGAFVQAVSSDRTPPGAVVGFRAVASATPGDRSIGLSWTNPADPDLARVLVLRREGDWPEGPRDAHAAVVWDGPGERCRDAEVRDGVAYRYRVWALDAGSLASAPAEAQAIRLPVDDDGDGAREDQGDCDDDDARVHPGAPSLDCSATDWDCDGAGWDDAFCRAAAPPRLDDQCSRRSSPPACVPGRGCDWNILPDHTPCSITTEPDFSYDICVAGACRSPGTCGDAECNSPGPHFRLPPAIGHTEFERTEGLEPLVADRRTGLVWQGCPAGTSGSACGTGEPVALDAREALAWCDASAWGGHDDWRLPDRHELLSIVDHGRVGPAVDVAVFPRTSDYFWSSSSYVAGSRLVWAGYFNSGNIVCSPAEARQFVRCVRDGSPPPGGGPGWGRFARAEPRAGEAVVTDVVTGLTWQGCAAGLRGPDCSGGAATMLDRVAAGTACEALVWGGFDDWRLPDTRELDSILDTRRRSPAIDPAAFPGTPVGWYWAAPPYAGGPSTHAWHVNFSSGHVANFDRSLPCYVRCVRSATP